VIGPGCTLGTNAFVHYGVRMQEGAVLDADAFLMKGEDVPPRARYRGNPAREFQEPVPERRVPVTSAVIGIVAPAALAAAACVILAAVLSPQSAPRVPVQVSSTADSPARDSAVTGSISPAMGLLLFPGPWTPSGTAPEQPTRSYKGPSGEADGDQAVSGEAGSDEDASAADPPGDGTEPAEPAKTEPEPTIEDSDS
jgi:hypothetical protein